MNIKNTSFLPILCSFILLCYLFAGCAGKMQNRNIPERDLYQIKDSGELVVLTLYSSTSYFIYRGQEMGFQYELGEQFAKSLGVKLKVKVANSVHDLINKLNAGEGDLIAYTLPVTQQMKDSLTYCGMENITHQVLIQNNHRKILEDVTELVGKDIYILPGKYEQRIRNLNSELGGGIHIHQLNSDSVSAEDLIAKVANKEIPYTVADNDIAQLNKTYYPNINTDLVISFDQRSSWAVRKNSHLLAKAADEWFKKNATSPAYTASIKKYFEYSKQPVHSPILSLKEGKISVYDELFKKYAQSVNWDWRLLASLACTESNFNPNVVSWAGAKGLMQLMPRTARTMGIPLGKEKDPEESIKAAAKYIGTLDKSFSSISDNKERTLFVLAAYNAGIGHIYDAMALAGKYGKNPHIWQHHVDKYILLKSNEEYFNDPVCKNGYFRGAETYSFVHETIERYLIYKQKIR